MKNTTGHYILQIETATPVCSVALSLNGITKILKESEGVSIHAENLTVYIQEILEEANIRLQDLSAIAVSMGPGSYTGLRIGVSTAKGLCFGAELPLIAIDSLHSLVYGFKENQDNLSVVSNHQVKSGDYFCPMIDARRREVYQAIFTENLQIVEETKAEIVDENTFDGYLLKKEETLAQDKNLRNIWLFGSGADKFSDIFPSANKSIRIVEGFRSSAAHLSLLAYDKFQKQNFEDVAYFEPYYLKEFMATTPKKVL